MAFQSLFSKYKILPSFFCTLVQHKPSYHHFHSFPTPQVSGPLLPDLVNEISRLLSDHRYPHHDLELSLNPFSAQISTNLVDQVLKRCNNLGFSAHRAYSQANLPDGAIRSFNRMDEFGIKPTINDFDKLLFILCKTKHVKQAQQFFDQAKNRFLLTAKTYSILISGWGDIGDSEKAHELFQAMLEQGCPVDLLAYNNLLQALCKGGCVDEAKTIFHDMLSKRVEPDAFTYSIFIHSYCDADDVQSALRVLDKMRRYNILPNVFTYNCIIKRLCKNEHVEEAYLLLDEMISRGVRPDTWSYNAIQAYHCDHCEVNRAIRLMFRMEKDNCLPDRHTYNMVLKLLIRIGRFDKVTKVWGNMGDKKFYPSVSTYSVMIHGFCKKKGKLEEACKYFEMMIDEGIPPYVTTVEMLRNQLLGLGFLDHIEILAAKMRQSTSYAIQELANIMIGNRTTHNTLRRDEMDIESD